MKNIGIVLIVVGLIMLVIRGVNYTQKEKVVDLGPLEINKEENKTVSWPLYAGGLAVIAGIVLVLVDKKKT
jgi:uncharacterized membrane protein YidH (DUF202 family)